MFCDNDWSLPFAKSPDGDGEGYLEYQEQIRGVVLTGLVLWLLAEVSAIAILHEIVKYIWRSSFNSTGIVERWWSPHGNQNI